MSRSCKWPFPSACPNFICCSNRNICITFTTILFYCIWFPWKCSRKTANEAAPDLQFPRLAINFFLKDPNSLLDILFRIRQLCSAYKLHHLILVYEYTCWSQFIHNCLIIRNFWATFSQQEYPCTEIYENFAYVNDIKNENLKLFTELYNNSKLKVVQICLIGSKIILFMILLLLFYIFLFGIKVFVITQ